VRPDGERLRTDAKAFSGADRFGQHIDPADLPAFDKEADAGHRRHGEKFVATVG